MHSFVDLFSGAGLLSYGLKAGGLQPVMSVERCALASRSYRSNVADVVRTTDVGSTEALADHPRARIVVAGPPCQGFSTLGRRDPADVRNAAGMALLPHVDAADPDVVLVENVPPFLASVHWKRIANALRRRGYVIKTWTLDAADHGTAQHRLRSFTIATRNGIEIQRPTTSRLQSCRWAFEKPTDPHDPLAKETRPEGLAADRIATVPPCGDKRDIMRLRPDLCPPSWFAVGCQATDVWGRVNPDKPANTVRCSFQNPSKGRYLHPVLNRVLTLREGARLQGIPDELTFDGRRYPVARQIGNGVPVPLARAIGVSIAAALNTYDVRSSATSVTSGAAAQSTGS